MRAMEGTVKVRLLLTSAFLFVQIPTMQAQVTVDVSKITCEQVLHRDTTVMDAVKNVLGWDK